MPLVNSCKCFKQHLLHRSCSNQETSVGTHITDFGEPGYGPLNTRKFREDQGNVPQVNADQYRWYAQVSDHVHAEFWNPLSFCLILIPIFGRRCSGQRFVRSLTALLQTTTTTALVETTRARTALSCKLVGQCYGWPRVDLNTSRDRAAADTLAPMTCFGFW